MKIRYLKTHGNNKKGLVVNDVPDSTANALIAHGVIEEWKAPVIKKSTKK